jgi:cytochrome b561
MENREKQTLDAPVYSPAARQFHWLTVAAVFVMIPLGLAMDYRGNDLNIWDGLTNGMYSLHKLIGFVVLWLVLARLVYRLTKGAPPDEPTLEGWQKALSHLTHWGLYALLLWMPLTGWFAVQYYGATGIFDLFSLPSFVAKDSARSETVFLLHKIGAGAIILLIGAHVGAALFHYFIRKDGVMRRMLPGVGVRSLAKSGATNKR